MSKDDVKIEGVLAAVVSAAFLASAPAAEAKASTLARWYEGPVRYILTRREEKEFRALQDEASRSELIRQFWRRRDPIPETPENEARISFWRRVVEANEQFKDSPLPGWKTDRGKVYILIGPPTEIREFGDYRTGSLTIAESGLIQWIYDGVLKGPALGASFRVPFVRNNDGEYHLSSSARFASPGFDPLASYDRAASDIARIQSTLDYGPSDLGTALDQALLQTPPWQEKDFIDRVTSETFFGALPMRLSLEFFRASDSSTFAMVTCGVAASALAPHGGTSALPEFTAVARLSPQGGGEPVDIGEAAFAAAPTNASAAGEDLLLFQARAPLRPGRYDMYVGLFERIRLQTANVRAAIDVPDLRANLAISSVVLGRSLRPVPEGTGGYNRPFRISDFEIIPAIGAPYRSGNTFSALWQIYTDGPSGPGSGLQVESQFYRVLDGTETSLGKPRVIEDAEAVQAFSLELKGWPPSAYRFEVRVKDRQGRTATKSAGFVVQ